MAKVIVTDGLSERAIQMLESAGHEVLNRRYTAVELLAGGLDGAEAIVVRSATKVTGEVIRATPSLRFIGRAGVGVDNIDIDMATATGIAVCNAPSASTQSVVEFTIGHLIASSRKIVQADRTLRSGIWAKSELRGSEIAGKRLGVIGMGRIGRAVADAASALGMEVHAWSRSLTRERAKELGVEHHDNIDSLLESCTHITLHCSHVEETHHLIDNRRIGLMPGVAPDGTPCGNHLINVGRGGLIDEAAVLEALEDGRLSSCALDVFEIEPPADDPLLQHPRFHGSPHIGAATFEAQERVGTDIASALIDWFAGSSPSSLLNGVNPTR